MKTKKIIIIGLMLILVSIITYGTILTTSIIKDKEIVVDTTIKTNLKDSGITDNILLSECEKIDEVYCKFTANNNQFFFDDFRPDLGYIQYENKTTEQIENEMLKNTETMLKFYSELEQQKKDAVEEVPVLLTNKLNINIVESIK